MWGEGCRLSIAVTNNADKLDTPLMYNIMALQKPDQYIIVDRGLHIKAASLNSHVNIAADNKCTHILFLDADMEFPIDIIPRLLSHNLPIVGGLYHIKTLPFSPIAGWNINGDKDKKINGRGKPWKYDYYPLPKNQLVEVDWTGIGCLLVNMDVFNKIYFPCFYDEWDKEQGHRKDGHDINFCYDVKQTGYKVFVDTSVSCGHRTVMVVDELLVDAWHQSNIIEITRKLAKERNITLPGHKNRMKHIEEVDKAQAVFKADEEGPEKPAYWDVRWGFDAMTRRLIKRENLIDFIKPHVSKDTQVAELGCGYSTTLSVLKNDCGCKCYGYDFSPKAIQLQKEKLGIDGEVADLLNYNPNGTKYHTTILSHVLEHFTPEDAEKILGLSQRMTEHQCFISVPQENPECYDKDDIGRIIKREHKHIYTADELRNLLSKFFKVVEVKSILPTDEDGNKDMWVYRNHIAFCKKLDAESDEVQASLTG